MIGRPLHTLCAPESWAGAEPYLRELLAGRSVAPFELELVRYDGEPVYLEVSARGIRNGVGLKGVHCIARNLTERRHLEQQLLQSEKLSAIGQLVAGVAHELNNPLTSVSGYTQLLLRDERLPPELRQDLEQIYVQAERAAKIVQNLLIFAREHKPERTIGSVNEALRRALALQQYQLRVDNIGVRLELDPGLPPTTADFHQLQQVFLNLITNARYAMIQKGGRGTLTLRTGLERRLAGDDQIRIEVVDTGVGIPERDLPKIFNPFFTTKPVGQGTGLGLSICFGIVKEHEGQIWAESQLGVGTCVVVTLPVRAAPAERMPEALPDGEAEEPVASLRVLVVDDEEPVGNLLDRMLRTLGHRPTIVCSGEAGLEMMEREEFDVVLCDVRMPGLNGFDVLSALRAQNPDLAERLIFMSGDTLSHTTRAALEQNGNLFLAKPFSIEQVRQILNLLLKRRSIDSQQS